MSLADEFEILFNEQRKAVALATIPLFDRMEPETKKLFTAPQKSELEKSKNATHRRRTYINISFTAQN
jgi:hypothetical protein